MVNNVAQDRRISDNNGNVLALNSDGSLVIQSASIIGDGSQTVATAGSAVQLSTTSTACKEVIITARDTNTGKVYIGGSTVSSTRGIFIYPGQTIKIQINNLNKVYIDAETNDNAVGYTYLS